MDDIDSLKKTIFGGYSMSYIENKANKYIDLTEKLRKFIDAPSEELYCSIETARNMIIAVNKYGRYDPSIDGAIMGGIDKKAADEYLEKLRLESERLYAAASEKAEGIGIDTEALRKHFGISDDDTPAGGESLTLKSSSIGGYDKASVLMLSDRLNTLVNMLESFIGGTGSSDEAKRLFTDISGEYGGLFDSMGNLKTGPSETALNGYDKADTERYLKELCGKISGLRAEADKKAASQGISAETPSPAAGKSAPPHIDISSSMPVLRTASFGGFDKADVLRAVDTYNKLLNDLKDFLERQYSSEEASKKYREISESAESVRNSFKLKVVSFGGFEKTDVIRGIYEMKTAMETLLAEADKKAAGLGIVRP